MSIPNPDVQIKMCNEMLKRKYKFHIRDVCEIIDLLDVGSYFYGKQVVIQYPYYYREKGKQMYIVDLTPVPYTEDELKLVTKNINGEKETYEYLQKWLEKVGSEEYRKNYKSV
jgi:hypothetical protein